MAKRFFARYFIETPNALANRYELKHKPISAWKFNFGNNEISIYDHKHGLSSDSYIDESSLEQAELRSKTLIEYIVHLIDFTTSSASSLPLFISVYDASPNCKERNFKQFFYVPLPDRNISVIDKNIFTAVFSAFDRNKDGRIVRAISWLRKGYFEQKYIDRFIAFWTGLEAINEILAECFGIPLIEKRMKCPKCGESLGPITAGVKKLFIDISKVEPELFGKIRRARGKLLHGGGPLDNKFINEIKNYNSIVREVLITGIGKLLQIDDGVINNVIKKRSKTYGEKLRLMIKANLLNFNPPGLEAFGKQPRFDLTENKILGELIDNHGKLDIDMASNFKAVNADFNNLSLTIIGDENICVESVKIDEIKRGNAHAIKNLSRKRN